MKIILLEDVYKQGVAGELVDVAPGFARNYLIPRGMAVKATPGSLRQLENLRQHAEVRKAEQKKEYEQVAEKIVGLKLYFGVKAGETGKLYGSVTMAEIAERLHEELGLEIDRRRIGDQPLRELGIHQVPVRLDAELSPAITVIVHREDEDPQEAEARAIEEAAEAAAAVAEMEAEMEAEEEAEQQADMDAEAAEDPEGEGDEAEEEA